MKAYTDITQSKKLAEILSPENADMCYPYNRHLNEMYGDIPYVMGYKKFNKDTDIPCWSLAALLNILSKQDFIIKSDERNDGYRYNIDIPSRHCKIWFSSLLDAAFEMVCWLKKWKII